MIIGLDVGFGYTKIIFDDNETKKKAIFPSLISSYIPVEGFNKQPEIVTINGKPYIVGDKNSQGSMRVTREFIGSDEYLAIVGYSIYKVGIPQRVLIIGIPPQMYTKDIISGLLQKIKAAEMKADNGQKIDLPSVIKYVPQGAGIFFSHIVSGGSDDYFSNVVVLDVADDHVA